MSGTRYEARFEPEAWINDQAIPVDAEGPQRWDCTEYAEQNRDYLDRLEAHSESLRDGAVDNDDVFKDDPAAPAWVREWRGPFTIRIVEGEWWTTAERVTHESHHFGDIARNPDCRPCAKEARNSAESDT